MQHAFLYISLPSLHFFDGKMPNFTFYGGRKQATAKFSFFFWRWICRFLGRNSAQKEFSCIWQSKWVGVIALEIENKFNFQARFWWPSPSWNLKLHSIISQGLGLPSTLTHWAFSSKTHRFENALKSGSKQKRRHTVLVWTDKNASKWNDDRKYRRRVCL